MGNAEVAELRLQLAAAKRRIERQARELANKDATLAQRTRDLDAMHWVWCDGGCYGGTHRYGHSVELTADIVLAAQRNAYRLANWHRAKEWRQKHDEVTAALDEPPQEGP